MFFLFPFASQMEHMLFQDSHQASFPLQFFYTSDFNNGNSKGIPIFTLSVSTTFLNSSAERSSGIYGSSPCRLLVKLKIYSSFPKQLKQIYFLDITVSAYYYYWHHLGVLPFQPPESNRPFPHSGPRYLTPGLSPARIPSSVLAQPLDSLSYFPDPPHMRMWPSTS